MKNCVQQVRAEEESWVKRGQAIYPNLQKDLEEIRRQKAKIWGMIMMKGMS
jgi:hypothetical protein